MSIEFVNAEALEAKCTSGNAPVDPDELNGVVAIGAAMTAAFIGVSIWCKPNADALPTRGWATDVMRARGLWSMAELQESASDIPMTAFERETGRGMPGKMRVREDHEANWGFIFTCRDRAR